MNYRQLMHLMNVSACTMLLLMSVVMLNDGWRAAISKAPGGLDLLFVVVGVSIAMQGLLRFGIYRRTRRVVAAQGAACPNCTNPQGPETTHCPECGFRVTMAESQRYWMTQRVYHPPGEPTPPGLPYLLGRLLRRRPTPKAPAPAR